MFQEAKKQVGLGPRATSDSEGAAVREYELEKIQFSPTSLSKHVSLDALTSSHEAGVKQGNSDSLQGSIVASDASLIQSTWTVSLLSQPDIV